MKTITRNVDILLGLQWGDEGKGKIVDVLAPHYDVIARFQGGPNAGHTLEFNGMKHVLHAIPSGIFRENTINFIGNGVVIDPIVLRGEVEKIQSLGFDPRKNLFISRKAHLILPTHRLLDDANEAAKGDGKIGTTGKGIGPAYTSKVARRGLRVGDITSKDFISTTNSVMMSQAKKAKFTYSDIRWIGKQEIDEFFEAIEFLMGLNLVDGEYFINDLIRQDKKILAEGAQGTMLDIDFGSYPFVTSSNTIAAGACTGLGISPIHIGRVIGVFKAYCTRVGSGPFPTELFDDVGKTLQKKGNEFGATTGRERRCGWLDLPALKYACMINGVTELMMMKSDVMSDFQKINVGVEYKAEEGKNTKQIPFGNNNDLIPASRDFEGWGDISKARHRGDLPENFNQYVEFLEGELETPIRMVSVGPDREETIEMVEM